MDYALRAAREIGEVRPQQAAACAHMSMLATAPAIPAGSPRSAGNRGPCPACGSDRRACASHAACMRVTGIGDACSELQPSTGSPRALPTVWERGRGMPHRWPGAGVAAGDRQEGGHGNQLGQRRRGVGPDRRDREGCDQARAASCRTARLERCGNAMRRSWKRGARRCPGALMRAPARRRIDREDRRRQRLQTAAAARTASYAERRRRKTPGARSASKPMRRAISRSPRIAPRITGRITAIPLS